MTDLAPGKYTVKEENMAEVRTIEVEVLPGQTCRCDEPTKTELKDLDVMEEGLDNLPSKQKAFINEALAYCAQAHPTFQDVDCAEYHRNDLGEYVVVYGKDVENFRIDKHNGEWRDNYAWTQYRANNYITPAQAQIVSSISTILQDKELYSDPEFIDSLTKIYGSSLNDELVTQDVLESEINDGGNVRINGSVFIFDVFAEQAITEDVLEQVAQQYAIWESANGVYGTTTFYLFRSDEVYQNIGNKNYRGYEKDALVTKTCIVNKDKTYNIIQNEE